MSLEQLTRCDICGSNRIATVDAENNICRCPACGFVFDNPRPDANDIERFYSRGESYGRWLSQEEGRAKMWLRRLAMVRRYKQHGGLLDVGAGIGHFVALARCCFDASGTEVSDAAVRIAAERYGVNLRRGVLEDVEFDRRFDVITLFHVLEHMPSPSALIARCLELLNEDGVLVIAVPNEIGRLTARIWRLARALRLRPPDSPRYSGLTRIQLDGPAKEIHLAHFTPGTLGELLRRSGLSVVRHDLDPYYPWTGLRRLACDLKYWLYRLVLAAASADLYDATLVIAKRDTGSHPAADAQDYLVVPREDAAT